LPSTGVWALPLLLPILPAGQAPAVRPPVVVVEGDFLGPDGADLGAEARKYAESVQTTLETACVAFETSKDSTVEKWGLPQTCRVAVLPYNRAISGGELAALRGFADSGGKLIVFFLGPDELLARVGVRGGEIVGAERPGQFAGMLRAPNAPSLVPAGITQSSWNVRRCEPLPGSVVLAHWADAQGARSDLPAVVLGESGAFISHVFVPGDDYRKGLLLRAVIGHFVPEIWPGVVRREIEYTNSVGRFGTLDRLADYLERRHQAGHRVDSPLASAQKALALRQAARERLAAGDDGAAAEASCAARTAAGEAFYGTYPPKPGELRGAWMIYKGRPTWDDTMRRLREANFNAVMPRFCSAGVAYFPSNYLPQASFSKQHGDQLAAATAAARKYGIAVHARMLALFVYEAPPGVREAYKQAGRLMVSEDGDTLNWVCPSHPENRKMVVGACLEMASRYPVAGIQLDYIRYEWKTCCCSTCKAKFQRDLNVRVDKWPFDCLQGKYRGRFADWRREQVTSLVREIRLRLKDLNPALQFSADVFINWDTHRDSFGQDWKPWVDEGLVDFVCPMDYTANDEKFAGYVRRQREWVRNGVPLCIGLGPRVESSALDPMHLLTQIEMSRDLGGDGFVLFEYDETLAANHLPVVGAGPSSTPTPFSVGPPYLDCDATPAGGATRLAARLSASRREAAGAGREGRGVRLELPEVVVEASDLKLYTTDAWPVADLGAIAADTPVTREVQLSDGRYRLCAQGRLARPGGPAGEEFVRWSLPFEVHEPG